MVLIKSNNMLPKALVTILSMVATTSRSGGDTSIRDMDLQLVTVGQL